ncbi:MAG: hypothetical protein ACE5JI_18705 [Acidobacteriota bacterium]
MSADDVSGVDDYIRAYSVAYSADAPIPAWARKYNMTCNMCHSPAAPRLNAMGIRFRWAGYRMPSELGTKVDVGDLSDYVSMRGRVRYDYRKTSDQPVSKSSFGFHDATLFFAGPYGKGYSAFFELEREAEDDIGLTAHIASAWGNEKSYGGFRVGLMHWLLRDGVAGFDRPTGIATPTPLANPLSATIPFRFSKDQLGLEAYYVSGSNRVSAEILNGVNSSGSGGGADFDTRKDFVVTDQLLLDNSGSGLTAVGYYGTIVGLDASEPTLSSHYWRLGLSVNKFIKHFEVIAGGVYGKDRDLPAVVSAADTKAFGFWGQVQYMFTELFPESALTLFGRYEFVDPNTDVDDNANTRIVAGSVLPVNLPEYLRLALEYTLDSPQLSGAPKTHGITAEVMLNF